MSGLATLVVLAATLPTAAQAGGNAFSPADLRYCKALSEKYMRYVGSDEFTSGRATRAGEVEGRVAVAKCQEGDAAAAIPVLERKLIGGRVTVPSRN